MTSSVSDFGRDHGLIHEVVVTGRKAGWTADEWSKLAHSEETMRNFRKVLLGHAEIITSDHLIDLDAYPFVPDGWSVEEHRKGGVFKWDAAKVALYFSQKQQNGKYIEGNKLCEELAKRTPFNVNLLDYLLARPHLIPEEWKCKLVFFLGTIYRSRSGALCIRYLYWHYWYGGQWHWDYRWLDFGWSDSGPAAVPAS